MGTSFRHMTLPTAATTTQGFLVIYSLAHQEVFSHFPIPPFVGAGKGEHTS